MAPPLLFVYHIPRSVRINQDPRDSIAARITRERRCIRAFFFSSPSPLPPRERIVYGSGSSLADYLSAYTVVTRCPSEMLSLPNRHARSPFLVSPFFFFDPLPLSFAWSKWGKARQAEERGTRWSNEREFFIRTTSSFATSLARNPLDKISCESSKRGSSDRICAPTWWNG